MYDDEQFVNFWSHFLFNITPEIEIPEECHDVLILCGQGAPDYIVFIVCNYYIGL
jgi:hypothetical protein